jgi:hypothetical protein
MPTCDLAAPRTGLQLQQTALTVNAMPQNPDARMLPNSETPSWCCQLQALRRRHRQEARCR